MRLESEYAIEKDDRTGKAVPRKIGLAPTARKGTEYEFDFVLEITPEEKVIVVKTRNGELLPLGSVHARADLPKIARRLVDWLNEGVEETPEAALGRRIDAADAAELQRMLLELKAFTDANPDAGTRLRQRYAARRQKLAEQSAGGGA